MARREPWTLIKRAEAGRLRGREQQIDAAVGVRQQNFGGGTR
jgi:hypothetical protein